MFDNIDAIDAQRRAIDAQRGYQYLADVRRHAQTKAIERLLRTNPWENPNYVDDMKRVYPNAVHISTWTPRPGQCGSAV